MHGDGKTRTIVFLHSASNNLAATVLHHLQCAVNQYGLPERVRTDRGGENVDVWCFMIQMHEITSSVIAGSSTHNVHIEHLWRDTFRCVIGHYYELFYSLEEQQLLNPLNKTDMYCLHYIFIPRINKHLHDFIESWNHPALSTEHNQTPYQLMLLGLIDNPPQAVTSYLSSGSQPLPQHLSVNQHVQVPRSKFDPCSSLMSQVTQSVNPLQKSSEFGCELYVTLTHIVAQHLQQSEDCNCELND